MVELDPMASPEFLSKLRFDRFLFGREECSDGIADEIQRQPASRLAVAEPIEKAKRLDRLLKHALASLRIGLAGAVVGQRRDDFHTMPGEELCQVRLRWKEENSQVTSIHHMATQCSALFNQPATISVKFRCTTRDIDRWNIGLSERTNALLCRFAGHVFGPIRPRIDMAVPTNLIAEFANIDLKDRDPGGAKREQADSIELHLKGRAVCCPSEDLQLFRRGGKGVMLSQQCQSHACACQKRRIYSATDRPQRT